jgi:hypothetical protein
MQIQNIKPSVAPAGRIELCGLDFVGGYRYYEGLRFFDAGLDPARFREALAKMVNAYPLLGGKLVQDGARLFIDYDGPGILYAEAYVDAPCPAFGPGIPQINQRNLFLPKPTLPAEPMGRREPPFGKPLMLHKLTRFADGRYVLGCTTCHVLCDATAIGASFEDCYRFYSGEPIPGDATFSRDALISLGDPDATMPTSKSGLTVGEVTPDSIRLKYFESNYAAFSISAEQRRLLETLVSRARSRGKTFSWNDLIHALFHKCFAQALPDSQEEVAANLAYDIRRIKGLETPANYCGNAVLHRWLQLPRAEVVAMSITDLAMRFAEFGVPDPLGARQDIGFLQREYLAGRFNEVGLLTHVQPPIGPGSLIINNLSAAKHTQQAFGGHALWTDLAINEPLPVRMVIIYPDVGGGMTSLMILSSDQVEPFRAAWERNLQELIRSASDL